MLVTIVSFAVASAQDTDLTSLTDAVYVQASSVPVGSQQTLSIMMKNSFAVQSIQFDLYLPDGITIVKNDEDKLVTASKARVKSFDYFNSSIQTDGALRLLAQATTTNIDSGDGEIATIIVSADPNMAQGSYQMTVKKISLVSKENYSPEIGTDIKTTITVGPPADPRIVLDETSTTMPEAASDVDVRVKRTIKAGEWSTICLPFAMTAAQVTSAFGADVQLADFTGYDTVEDADNNVVGLTVNFTPVTAIEANHPYIIKVSSLITEFTVDNVTIDPEDEPCVEYDNGLTGKKRVVWGSFTGTYVADYVIPYSGEDVSLFLSGNKMYYASAQTQHMKGYRAYFWFADILPESSVTSAPSRINFSFNEDGESTQILSKSLSQDEGAWFDLSGRKLEGEPIVKGAYIHNGNKVILK